jgi:hypothetical protein
VPRKVAVPHAAGVLLAALALLAAPARACAESLSIAGGSDPVAGLPNGVDYDYDTGLITLNLQVLARPAAGPPCQPTIVLDEALIGTTGGAAYVTPLPLALTGAGFGRVPFTFAAPGRQRICAWLYRSPDDTVELSSAEVDVRVPATTVAPAATEVGASAGGADLSLRVAGSTEAPADLYVTVQPAATSCPTAYDENVAPTELDVAPAGTATRVSGAFDLQFLTRERLSFQRWRACAFLQDGPTAPAANAVGTTIIDFVLKPALLRRPKVTRTAGTLTCDGGRFKAKPAATFAYAWLRPAAPIPGAHGRRLAITPKLRGRTVRCRVTARNRLGATVAASRAITVR